MLQRWRRARKGKSVCARGDKYRPHRLFSLKRARARICSRFSLFLSRLLSQGFILLDLLGIFKALYSDNFARGGRGESCINKRAMAFTVYRNTIFNARAKFAFLHARAR